MSVNDLGGQFALDMQGIQRLKHTSRQDPNAGLDEAARQFEALFLQMVMKSMREAGPKSDLMSSQQSEFYDSLLDQQWAQHLSGRGIGLAEQLISQLEGRGMVPEREADARRHANELIAGIPRGTPRVLHDGLRSDIDGDAQGTSVTRDFLDELDARLAGDQRDIAGDAQNSRRDGERPEHVQVFLERLTAPAQAASRATGVPAELILAQAALETGWGSHEIPTRNGGNSHNLFGIKAGGNWQGDTTDITTHEYINGQRTRVTDTFRVYGSFEDAFTDYARLIGDNPRYAGVVAAPSAERAARALQDGGYATDPAYADKLVAIMNTMGLLDGRMLAQAESHDVSAERVPSSIF
ncbi:flagellar assembly peptidoglycan hydrolase FlgJ [Litchfieldella rifensis]|uniref:Peptidoglycan hydrolase FlgJ n=1 Tax=Litchfieldella rifensis TaxID=762643 RepID=A0ABV7LUA9_9GAMM